MINTIKAKFHSLAVTVISILIVLQIIMPTTVDLVLGLLIIAIFYGAPKVSSETSKEE